MNTETAHALIEAVAKFVSQTADLRGLALLGSWARGTPTPISDLDLLMLAERPESYVDDVDWLAALDLEAAGFRLVAHEPVRYGVVTSYFLLLEPAAELELTIAHLDWALTDDIDRGTAAVVRGGFKIVVDKDERLRRLMDALSAQRKPENRP